MRRHHEPATAAAVLNLLPLAVLAAGAVITTVTRVLTRREK